MLEAMQKKNIAVFAGTQDQKNKSTYRILRCGDASYESPPILSSIVGTVPSRCWFPQVRVCAIAMNQPKLATSLASSAFNYSLLRKWGGLVSPI